MKLILTITLLLMATAAVHAQAIAPPTPAQQWAAQYRDINRKLPDKVLRWASHAVLISGSIADIASSIGSNKREVNPLLRGRDGGISVWKAVTVSAVPELLSLWLDHKHRSKAAAISRFIAGGVHWSVAAHNFGVK